MEPLCRAARLPPRQRTSLEASQPITSAAVGHGSPGALTRAARTEDSAAETGRAATVLHRSQISRRRNKLRSTFPVLIQPPGDLLRGCSDWLSNAWNPFTLEEHVLPGPQISDRRISCCQANQQVHDGLGGLGSSFQQTAFRLGVCPAGFGTKLTALDSLSGAASSRSHAGPVRFSSCLGGS